MAFQSAGVRVDDVDAGGVVLEERADPVEDAVQHPVEVERLAG